MKTEKNKSCCDCLHCKVSAVKIDDKTLYFCNVSKNKARNLDIFWLVKKKLCKKFVDMDDEEKRRPLLRNRG